MIKELVVTVAGSYIVGCVALVWRFARQIDKEISPKGFREWWPVLCGAILKNKTSACWLLMVTILLCIGLYIALAMEKEIDVTSGEGQRQYGQQFKTVDDLSIALSSLHASLDIYGEESPVSLGAVTNVCRKYSEIKRNTSSEKISALSAQQSEDLDRAKDVCNNMQRSKNRLEVFKDVVMRVNAEPISVLAHVNNLSPLEKNIWDAEFAKSTKSLSEIVAAALGACNVMLENLLDEYQAAHSWNVAKSIVNLENEVSRADLHFNKALLARLHMFKEDQKKRKQALTEMVKNYINVKSTDVSKRDVRLEMLKEVTDDGLVYSGGLIRSDDGSLSSGERAAMVGSIEQKRQIIDESTMYVLALSCDAASGDGRVAEFLKQLSRKLEDGKIKVSSVIRHGMDILNVSDVSIQKKEVYSSTGETLFLFSARLNFHSGFTKENLDLGAMVGEGSSKDSVEGIAKARSALIDKIVWNVASIIKK